MGPDHSGQTPKPTIAGDNATAAVCFGSVAEAAF